MALVDLAARLDLPRPTLDSALFWNDKLKWDTLDALIARDQDLIQIRGLCEPRLHPARRFFGCAHQEPQQGAETVPTCRTRSRAHGF